jgi:hypothetical protein
MISNKQTRTCKKCCKELAINSFKQLTDHTWTHVCKGCRSVEDKLRRKVYIENIQNKQEKQCNDCNKIKPISEYCQRGIHFRCRECESIFKKLCRNVKKGIQNAEKVLQEYKIKHPTPRDKKEKKMVFGWWHDPKIKEKSKKLNADWYKRNKEHHLALQKKRLSDPVKKELLKQTAKNYYYREDIVQKRLARKGEYYKKNKDKIAKYNVKYSREKYKTDPQFRLGTCIRTRIKDALTYNRITSIKKTQRTEELLGCTIEECKIYLESLFKEGMSWDNYGYRGWHIDHIVPCSAFDLTNIEEQKKCFHYTNLQPLWAKDNLSKGNKFTWSKSNEHSDPGHPSEVVPTSTGPEALIEPLKSSQATVLQAVG